ncbi:hypothetical protein MNBD_GAMMA16-2302 [hydrothermal vent metagenome]|uniref:DUF2959 domain-containing protein n=1 Tax=hydrothermal vent metagenome TaxID=652676 RepID=A0A3B0ZC12_9ZZZZ
MNNHNIKSVTSFSKVLLLLCGIALLTGCSTTYYSVWEKMGKHKRDLLRDHVESAREEQADAQEQFKSALQRLKELQNFDGGELEDTYEALKDDYDESVEHADDVKDRIETVDDIAHDLFGEWEEEIELISNARFKSDSKKKLRTTRKKYATLNRSMVKAVKSMEKVLTRFQDHVLYLKHNLNAQAIGGLDAEVVSIGKDVKKLISDMETSIAQADSFIATLE